MQSPSPQSNPERERARQIVEHTGSHLFLTGRAGTGKTTFLRELKEASPKRMVVVAPTGIAAINAGGVTIHSFFQLPFAPFVPDASYGREQFRMGRQKLKIIRSLELLVIDEISMVRADLLDAVDAALRRYRRSSRPFGGVQLLLIGDLQQLAPVVKDEEWALLSQHYDSPYFFSSRALRQTDYLTIELRTVYRQTDGHFLDLLNSVREQRADAAVLDELNRRCRPGFRPAPGEDYIRLVTHNRQADRINQDEMDRLPGQPRTFRAVVQGNYPDYAYPTAAALTLKPDAQIMFVKNDQAHRFYNGMIGRVVELREREVLVRRPDGSVIAVAPEEWTYSRYVLDDVTREIREEKDGLFRQMPLRPAWAITIHKSQGLTFSHAIIDAAASFAHGQAYVALSRCRTLEGLVLDRPLSPSSIVSDATVEEFNRDLSSRAPDAARVEALCRDYFVATLAEHFDFSGVRHLFDRLLRLMQESFGRLYPDTVAAFEQLRADYDPRLTDVAARFRPQYVGLASTAADYAADATLQERLRKGAAYFADALAPLAEAVAGLRLTTDNKELHRRTSAAVEELRDAASLKLRLLRLTAGSGFSLRGYLHAKAVAGADEPAVADKARKKTAGVAGKPAKAAVPSEVLHPELYRRLTAWRAQQAKTEGLPAYCILQQRALLGVANLLPRTSAQLLAVPYLGARVVEKYGAALLELVAAHGGESAPDLFRS